MPAAWRCVALAWAALAATGLACEDDAQGGDAEALESACEELGARLQECGLLGPGPTACADSAIEAVLDTTAGEAAEIVCHMACFEAAECGALNGLLCEESPSFEEALSIYNCLLDCAEQYGFQCQAPGAGLKAVPVFAVCDGASDCVDGSDEAGCQLFDCGDGQSVATDAVCDGFLDCNNQQDEAMGCAQFACANGSMVPAPYQCDAEDDCGDGSDELGCPQVARLTCSN